MRFRRIRKILKFGGGKVFRFNSVIPVHWSKTSARAGWSSSTLTSPHTGDYNVRWGKDLLVGASGLAMLSLLHRQSVGILDGHDYFGKLSECPPEGTRYWFDVWSYLINFDGKEISL